METFIALVFFLGIVVAVIIIVTNSSHRPLSEFETNIQEGYPNAELFCPHCQTKGHVRVKWVTQKAGVSGGKATAAILTGGFSLLAVGLSRKQELTQAHCDKCGSTWTF